MSPRAACRLESLGFQDVYEYRPGKVDWLGAGLPTVRADTSELRVGDLARGDVPTCRSDEPLADVVARTQQAGWDTCFVTSPGGIVFGRLDRAQLESGVPTAREAMKPGPVTYRPHEPVADLAHLMEVRGIETLPVTTGDGRLIGALRRREVVGAHAGHGRIEGRAEERPEDAEAP